MRKQPDFLDDIADAAAQADRIPLAGGAPFYEKIAFAGREQMIDQFKSRSLAGAASSEKNQGFTANDFEVQIVKKLPLSVVTQAIRNAAKLNSWTRVGGIVHPVGFPCALYGWNVGSLFLLVSPGRQACDTNSRVPLVPDIEADQQCRDLFQDARVLKFAAIESTNTDNL